MGRAVMPKAGSPLLPITISSEELRVVVLPFGATLAEVHVGDRDGAMGDVVLGMKDWKADSNPCMNCVIGRTAGRTASPLEIDGKKHVLPGCDGGGGGVKPETCLHGGMTWNSKAWTVVEQAADRVTLSLDDPAGPFPGDVKAKVTYAVDRASLSMVYEATTTAKTPISLTNHAYWNLSAGESPTVGSHTLKLHCDAFRPDDGSGDGVPRGARTFVRGTGRDATSPLRMASVYGCQAGLSPHWIHGEEYEVTENRGRDPNRPPKDGTLPPIAAVLAHPGSGRVMTVHTTEPALQTYYSTLLSTETAGKKGVVHERHGAVCLECQRHANAEGAGAPSRLIGPDQIYRQTTVHVFSTDKPAHLETK